MSNPVPQLLCGVTKPRAWPGAHRDLGAVQANNLTFPSVLLGGDISDMDASPQILDPVHSSTLSMWVVTVGGQRRAPAASGQGGRDPRGLRPSPGGCSGAVTGGRLLGRQRHFGFYLLN